MQKRVYIIGGGGHAKVIANIVEKVGDIVAGFLDDNLPLGTKILGYEVVGKVEDIYKFKENYFIIGIGNNSVREMIVEKYPDVKYYTAIHPNANIEKDVQIGEGTAIMAGVNINVSVKIGNHCIINTGCIVEHDNCISDYVHISPNATLAGTVNVDKKTHIGVGATVKNNISICENVVVGAGAVVVKNIEEEGTYIGVPAKIK